MKPILTLFGLAIGLAIILAGAAAAGPWLRERGTGFSAFSFASTVDYDLSTQSYLEYGVSDLTTLGVDIGYYRSASALQSGYATVFLRRALSAPEASSKWAYEIGLGANWSADVIAPHLKTTLTWGRGLSFAERSGWTTVDATVIWDPINADHVAKLDSTVGINLTDRFAGMMQLYLRYADGAAAATVAPSVILSPKTGKFRIQIGAEIATDAPRQSLLKIGLWRDF